MSEQRLTRSIVDSINASGRAWCWRNNKGAMGHVRFGGPDGASDILGMMTDGRFLAIEVKMPAARTEKARLGEQRAFLERVVRLGGVAGFACSEDEALALVCQAVPR